MSDSVGCGAAGAGSGPRVLSQDADHAAQLLECLAGGRAQQLGGLAHRLDGKVGADLQRAGVQRDQGDSVREHVVHLACDPGALRHARPVGVQALVGLRAQRPLRSVRTSWRRARTYMPEDTAASTSARDTTIAVGALAAWPL